MNGKERSKQNLRPATRLNAAHKLSYEDKRDVLKLYRSGLSMGEVGRRFGVTRQAVWQFLKSRNEPTRPQYPRSFDGNGEKRWEHDEAGITVTLRRQDTLELHSMHVPGKAIDALRYVCERIDRSGIDWRLYSYSTPKTILGDMQKKRVVNQEGQQAKRPAHLFSIEANVLGRIGRKELLDPTLDLGSGHRQKRGRRK